MPTEWHQSTVTLPSMSRGCHLVTNHVLKSLHALSACRVGLLHVFIRHTSASLTINENADPDVPLDLASSLDRIAPESWPYRHTCEGPDDMPAHVKTALTDSSVSMPVANGQLLTGTWQGIYLCEFRDHGGARKLIVTLHGDFDQTS